MARPPRCRRCTLEMTEDPTPSSSTPSVQLMLAGATASPIDGVQHQVGARCVASCQPTITWLYENHGALSNSCSIQADPRP